MSDNIDSEYVRMLEDRGQLQTLASKARSSQSSYNNDVDTLSSALNSALNSLDVSSIVLSNAVSILQTELSVDTYDSEYNSAISSVVSHTP